MSAVRTFADLDVGAVFCWLPRDVPAASPGRGQFKKVSAGEAIEVDTGRRLAFARGELVLIRHRDQPRPAAPERRTLAPKDLQSYLPAFEATALARLLRSVREEATEGRDMDRPGGEPTDAPAEASARR